MIYLNIQAEDAEVEALLKFMRTQFPDLLLYEQIFTMERAILWLRATDECGFGSTSPNAVQLAFEVPDLASSLPTHKPDQSPLTI